MLAHTLVAAIADPDVRAVFAAQVQPVRIGELARIPVRRRDVEDDALARPDRLATGVVAAARKLNVKVEFVKTDKDLMEKMEQNGEEKPSLIIFDLNLASVKPLTLIPKLKSKLKKGTSIIGFLSHVQGDLKQKAHEVGCDMVLPRSAFSQNLPQLLRRHGAPEDAEPTVQ